ncbi:hypothetical protein QQP08_001898 [Theobroma cacao]|nr:hypothetical protein QQP08_001898 [Theobroma cacao]
MKGNLNFPSRLEQSDLLLEVGIFGTRGLLLVGKDADARALDLCNNLLLIVVYWKGGHCVCNIDAVV